MQNKSKSQNGHALITAIVLLGLVPNATLHAQEKSRQYDREGVKFKYLEGWKVATDQTYVTTRLISLHGPKNAIVTIQFTESSIADSLKVYAKEYSNEAAKALRNAKLTKVSFGKQTKEKAGYLKLVEEFTLSTVSDDPIELPHRRVFRKKEFGDYSCLMVTQASISNFEAVEKGFEVVVRSLSRK